MQFAKSRRSRTVTASIEFGERKEHAFPNPFKQKPQLKFKKTTIALICLILITAWLLVDVPLSNGTRTLFDNPPINDQSVGSTELAELFQAGKSRAIRRSEVWERCDSLDRACVIYVLENETEEMTDEAEDRAFAKRYAQVHPIALGIGDVLGEPARLLSELIDANKDIYLSELVRAGTIAPSTVAPLIRRHRIDLEEASTLIEKIFFVAVVAIDLNAANIALSGDPTAFATLQPYLEPLTNSEIGIRKLVAGETQFGAHMIDESGKDLLIKRNHAVNLLHKFYSSHIDSAEAPWKDYWGNAHSFERVTAFDYLINPIGTLAVRQGEPPDYLGIISTIRSLDGKLNLTRALHSSNNLEPFGEPETAPLSPWQWAWDATPSLCLEPKLVHETMERHAASYCLSWLKDLVPLARTD